jgi:hypothetical protein
VSYRMEGAIYGPYVGPVETESTALCGQSSSLDMESSLVILVVVVITLYSIACDVVCVLHGGNPRGVLELPVSEL